MRTPVMGKSSLEIGSNMPVLIKKERKVLKISRYSEALHPVAVCAVIDRERQGHGTPSGKRRRSEGSPRPCIMRLLTPLRKINPALAAWWLYGPPTPTSLSFFFICI